jgi:hypothetical protein
VPRTTYPPYTFDAVQLQSARVLAYPRAATDAAPAAAAAPADVLWPGLDEPVVARPLDLHGGDVDMDGVFSDGGAGRGYSMAPTDPLLGGLWPPAAGAEEDLSDPAYQRRHAAHERRERVEWQAVCRALGNTAVAHHGRPLWPVSANRPSPSTAAPPPPPPPGLIRSGNGT